MNQKTQCHRFSLAELFLVVVVVSGLSCIFTLQVVGQRTHAAGLIDNTPKFLELDAQIEKGRGPDALDARKPYVRFRGKRSKARLQLDCHPERQNYLTVKVWGGSGSPGSKLTLKSAGLLLHQRTAEPFPGRFYYATQPIPRKQTDGETTVTVTLQAKGGQPGPDVYNIYTHVGAFFRPPSDELQGEPFELGPPDAQTEEVSTKEAAGHWKQQADRLVKKTLNMKSPGGKQIYGEEWKQRIEDGWRGIPEGTYGALLRKPGRVPSHTVYGDRFDTKRAQWFNWLAEMMGPNLVEMFVLEAWAMAYNAEWSNYHQDEELLKRVTAALDFYTRAQGKNGGFIGDRFYSHSNRSTWNGAPDRGIGKQGLESGQQSLYRSYNLLKSPMKEAGLLDKNIDHDLNPDTAKIPRGEAYTKMARRSFPTLLGWSRKSIANQALHNFFGAVSCYNALKDLDPEMAAPQESKLRHMTKQISGLTRTSWLDHYLFSPAGLNNENKYTAGGYGHDNPKRLVKLYRRTGYDFLQDRIDDAYETYSYFCYFANNSDGNRRLFNTGWISSRSRIGIPGGQLYMTDDYAARSLEIPVVLRHHELVNQHKGGGTYRLSKPTPNKLDISRGLPAIMRKANRLHRRAETGGQDTLPESNYRLPAEREEATAFADPYMQDVAIHHGEATLFLECWTEDLARLRYRTPEFERLAHIPMDNVGPDREHYFGDGSMLNVMRYGPYLIAMNGSEEQAYEFRVPEPFRKSAGNRVKELQQNKTVELPPKVNVPPMEGYAFAIE